MKVSEGVRAALGLLDRRDRRLYVLAVIIGMTTSLLDLAGILLLGGVGALALSTIARQAPPDIVGRAISSLGLGGQSPEVTIAVLTVAGGSLLIAKSVITPLLLRRSFRFLARREALIATRLTKELLSRPLTFVQMRPSQETTAALVGGVNAAMIIVLGQLIAAYSEVALLAILASLLLLTNAIVALGVIVFFAVVSLALQQALGRRTTLFARRRRIADIASATAVQEAVGMYREISVTNRRALYVDQLQTLRTRAAEAAAGLQFVNVLAKYVAEITLVVGALILAGAFFATESASAAAGAFSVFLVAATRIMPSILRLQTAVLAIRSGAAQAEPTFLMAKDLGHPVDKPRADEVALALERALRRDHADFPPEVVVQDVSFTYPGSTSAALTAVSLNVRAGQTVALVGSSGGGKSTFADVVLGILLPQSGQVTIGGISPREAIDRWPGAIAYVPQHTFLTYNSVRANIAMGIASEYVDDQLVWDALRQARLAEFVLTQPDGLDTQVGERGVRLSGGQRQRLGLARALFTKPKLIVLDEATSSLDAETEAAITSTLDSLDASVTRIIIAHRLSTIQNADVVVYFEHGRILTTGTFDDVCARVPALRRQAVLMGLRSE